MKFYELFVLAVGLSMDAFAVSISSGLSMQKITLKKSLIFGVYFGIFQAVMPIIGYYAASLLAGTIVTFDHWGAFVLLCFIGGKMIADSRKKEGCPDRECPEKMCDDRVCPKGHRPKRGEVPLTPTHMLPLALATSIDALAVGVSFAFLGARIAPAASFIGVITLVISTLGVKIGGVFGERFKSKAELAGGIILVLIGVKILFEHLGIVNF